MAEFPPIYPKWRYDFDMGCLLAEQLELRQSHAAGRISGFAWLKRERELATLTSLFKNQWARSAGIFGALARAKRELAHSSGDEAAKLQRKVWFLKKLCGEILEFQPRAEAEVVVPVVVPFEQEKNQEARRNPLGFYESLQAGRWLPTTLEHLNSQPSIYWRHYET